MKSNGHMINERKRFSTTASDTAPHGHTDRAVQGKIRRPSEPNLSLPQLSDRFIDAPGYGLHKMADLLRQGFS